MELALSIDNYYALEDLASGDWDGEEMYPELERLGLCVVEEDRPFLTIAGENVLEAVMGCGLEIESAAYIIVEHDEAFEEIDISIE